MDKKFELLCEYLKSLKNVAVAFSGGVDSVLLLKCAKIALGDNVLAITAKISSFPERELKSTKDFCEKEGIKHIVIDFDELSIDGFAQNPKNRCYICKKAIFQNILKAAADNNITTVLEGSNKDDDDDYRPGLRAIKELNIISPLQYAGITKDEVRQIAKKLGLEAWDKPSFACLSSRFAYGELITKEKLGMVEHAEDLLTELGVKQFRVRIHGDSMARVEVLPDEFEKILNARFDIINEFKKIGFSYIAMDLFGYRKGSMNETI